MKIVVLVKHVPCASGGLCFDADFTLRRNGVRAQLNEADAVAVDQALRIAVRRTGTQVTAVTMGPAKAAEALRQALICGADEGVHLLDDALCGSDALATSRVLAAAVRRLGFDLVLCGSAAAGSATSVVPAMVAERLGVPGLCFADGLRLTPGGEVEIRRDDGGCAETLAAPLPAVVSVTQRCGTPRYPKYATIMQARHKLIRTWPLSRLGIDRTSVGIAASATRVLAVTPVREPKRVVIACEPPAAAAQLADFLAAHDFL
jgi:electron transfer flavoprotein beta subunit